MRGRSVGGTNPASWVVHPSKEITVRTIANILFVALAGLSGTAACAASTTDPNEEGPSSATGESLVNTGGGTGGTSFTCNEPDSPGMCYCEPPATSDDCQKMKKNC